MKTTTGEHRHAIWLTLDNQEMVVRTLQHLVAKGNLVIINGDQVVEMGHYDAQTPYESSKAYVKPCKNGSIAVRTRSRTTHGIKTAYAKVGYEMHIVTMAK